VFTVKAIKQGSLIIKSILQSTKDQDLMQVNKKTFGPPAGSVNPSYVYCVKTSGIVLHEASFRLHKWLFPVSAFPPAVYVFGAVIRGGHS
jgi:hypothetical protein